MLRPVTSSYDYKGLTATVASRLAVASCLAPSTTKGRLTCCGIIYAKNTLLGFMCPFTLTRSGAITAFRKPCIRHRGAAYLFRVLPPVAPMKKFIFTPLLVHYSRRYFLILAITSSRYIAKPSVLIAFRAIHGTLFGRICRIFGPLGTSIHFLDLRL